MAELPRNNPKKALISAVVAGALTLGFAGMMAKSCGAPVNPRTEPANEALEMVDSLASRLVLGLDADATLQYATPSGAIVTVSQSAPRRAYRSAGVTYISTPDGTLLCVTGPAPSPTKGPKTAEPAKPPQPPVTCQEGPGADTMSPTEAKAISVAFGGEFMAPEAAVGRLATIAQGQGVRAGVSKRGEAQCVSVTATGIRTEIACVNPAGLLAYFQGTSDAGSTTELILQNTTSSVSDEAFLPPRTTTASPSPKVTARK
ncbi:hypothetical protein ABT297_21925 [Dactylosporangium sp. NPDC000555]|uniref:hypothetical protein n=1 Tax=Dactylosporangium sp. NPDC000555 TaxID=3154260 RepID=UPI003331BDCB